MTDIEVPGPGPDWQQAAIPPYYTGNNPAHQWSVWERCSSLFQMIGGLALPVQPVAGRLRLHVERSWDGLGELDVVLFGLRGFSFAISEHDGNPAGISLVWLTQRHEDADKALDVLLEVVGIGEEAVAFRGDPHEDPTARRSAGREDARRPQGPGPGDVPGTSRWARLRRLFGAAPSSS
ncbi:hypothetical protein ABR737_40670 [Streptomyces sp. Edi2]|uniref:hypothetical protein n=1 Tax=Streptomyces sp. Edi2 TaxID=3162528 RepID=UPI003305D2A9